MEYKICFTCKLSKPITEFNKCGLRKGVQRYSAYCKECGRAKWKEYHRQNREKLLVSKKIYRDNNKEKSTEWFRNLPEEVLDKRRENSRLYNKEHQEEKRTYDKNYSRNNRDKKNAYKNKKIKEDINFRLSCVLRRRISQILRNNKGKRAGSAVRDLGCSLQDFRLYLEGKFLPGMSWKNYGEWHIDHIIPLCQFDLTERNQFLKVCHYTNLQPLWAEDNLSKGKKIYALFTTR